jgi:hypothetical protein
VVTRGRVKVYHQKVTELGPRKKLRASISLKEEKNN